VGIPASAFQLKGLFRSVLRAAGHDQQPTVAVGEDAEVTTAMARSRFIVWHQEFP